MTRGRRHPRFGTPPDACYGLAAPDGRAAEEPSDRSRNQRIARALRERRRASQSQSRSAIPIRIGNPNRDR
jgi:hypothetical protein